MYNLYNTILCRTAYRVYHTAKLTLRTSHRVLRQNWIILSVWWQYAGSAWHTYNNNICMRCVARVSSGGNSASELCHLIRFLRQHIRFVRIQRIKIKLQKFPITLALIPLYYSFPVTDKLTHTLSNPHSVRPRAPLAPLPSKMAWTSRSVFSKLDLRHVCNCIEYVYIIIIMCIAQ